MMTKTKKARLYGQRPARLPRPKKQHDNGFSLRTIEQADGRFALIKRLRKLLQRLEDDAAVDTIQKEMLAARAVHLAQLCESLEIASTEGERIKFSDYLHAVNALSNVLSKLGLDKKVRKEIDTLESYVASKSNGRAKR